MLIKDGNRFPHLKYLCCIIKGMPTLPTIENQLKEASQLTNTVWAALVEREAGKWRVLANYRLAKKTHPALVKFLSRTEVDSVVERCPQWRTKPFGLPAESSKLEAGRLFAFPLLGGSRVVLVGANQLTNEAQRLWRLLISAMQTEVPTVDISPSSSVAASLLVPDLDSESPYDMPRALDRALTSFVRLVSVQGGWLAIRRGDTLEIHAQWNAPCLYESHPFH